MVFLIVFFWDRIFASSSDLHMSGHCVHCSRNFAVWCWNFLFDKNWPRITKNFPPGEILRGARAKGSRLSTGDKHGNLAPSWVMNMCTFGGWGCLNFCFGKWKESLVWVANFIARESWRGRIVVYSVSLVCTTWCTFLFSFLLHDPDGHCRLFG